MMKKEKIKVYIYTRVSTAMQIDGYSLDAQKSRMKAYAEFNDYEIVGEYEDAGKSGKSIEGRVEFNRMPYNYKGDLYKREIVKKLQDVGLDVKSVNALNKIMEKMGLLIHYGNGWGTTDAGAKFSMWHKGVLNSDSWHPELVDEIAKFLKK